MDYEEDVLLCHLTIIKSMSHKNVILNFSQVFKTVVKSFAGSNNHANSNEIKDDTVITISAHKSVFTEDNVRKYLK